MKKQKKSKTAAPKLGAPVFLYFSKCCNVRAEKAPLLKTPEKEGSLGSWRCSGCGKPCKCCRTINKLEKEPTKEEVK